MDWQDPRERLPQGERAGDRVGPRQSRLGQALLATGQADVRLHGRHCACNLAAGELLPLPRRGIDRPARGAICAHRLCRVNFRIFVILSRCSMIRVVRVP